MVKGGRQILVLCEGRTESIAIQAFLQRQWQNDGLRSVGLRPIILSSKLEEISWRVPLYRSNSSVAGVFTLIDLYGMERVQHDAYDILQKRVDTVKDWLRSVIGEEHQGFFHPHVSVHEVEAWLLAEGVCLAKRLKAAGIQPDPNAEQRNFDNPPSKRIDELFRKHRRGDGYHKIEDGIPLFQSLSFEIVYKSCRYFREFYDDLKQVGLSALQQS